MITFGIISRVKYVQHVKVSQSLESSRLQKLIFQWSIFAVTSCMHIHLVDFATADLDPFQIFGRLTSDVLNFALVRTPLNLQTH